jgi:hypothetical protein
MTASRFRDVLHQANRPHLGCRPAAVDAEDDRVVQHAVRSGLFVDVCESRRDRPSSGTSSGPPVAARTRHLQIQTPGSLRDII